MVKLPKTQHGVLSNFSTILLKITNGNKRLLDYHIDENFEYDR